MRLPEWHLTTAKARAAATVSKECVFPRRLGIAVASKLSVPTADSLDMAYIHDQRRQDARASEASHRSFWLIRKEIAADAHAEARLACWRSCSGVCGKLFTASSLADCASTLVGFVTVKRLTKPTR